MAFVKKTWTDRMSQYPMRRTLTKEGGGEEVVTVARNEGTVFTEGDAFDAENMNDLEDRIGEALENVSTKPKVYDTVAQMERDTDNIKVGEVVFTEDGNDVIAGAKVYDTLEDAQDDIDNIEEGEAVYVQEGDTAELTGRVEDLEDDVAELNTDLSELNCGRGYAEVTADGVKTISTLLNELYPLVDKSKISGLSYFEKMERRYNLQAIQPSYIVCSFVTVNPGFILTETMTLTESTSTYKSASTAANSTTFTDNSSVVLTSGTKLRLFY